MRALCRARRSVLFELVAACSFGMLARAAQAADAANRAVIEKVFALDITAGKTPAAQQAIRVEKNDLVKLRLGSDTAGEVHLHAYRKDARLVPGTPGEIAFKAYATGRFRIEWHAATDKNAKAGAHHAPPLAILEVRPK